MNYTDVIDMIRSAHSRGWRQLHLRELPIKILDRLYDEGFDVFDDGDTITISWEEL
jgi:hypothetical protein